MKRSILAPLVVACMSMSLSRYGYGRPISSVLNTLPSHEAAGCGGWNRLGPKGGAAYGIPLKAKTPSA